MDEYRKRLIALEEKMLQHLAESGRIQTDLKWLKKAFWVRVSAEVLVVVAILNHLWK